MELISPDRIKCVKCRACAEICPMNVIRISSDGFPEPTSSAYRLCINCGYCVDICVFGALNHKVRKRGTDSKAALIRYIALEKRKNMYD